MQNIDSIKSMSVQDGLELIETIWQTLDDDMLQEDEAEIKLQESRLKEFKKDPTQTEGWQQFKDRIVKKKNGGK